MNKKQVKIIISWTTVLIWMVVIFNLSSQPAHQSNKLSTGVTQVIIKTVKKVAPNTNFDIKKFNHYVRKNAHFFAYLVLGVLVMNALRRSDVFRYKFFALLICIFYAISDELQQIFVPGRGPQVKDVFIDSAGAVVGILAYLVIMKIKKKIMTVGMLCNR
ncbi:VanZ family protein [Sedimentibacter sp. zth1]|uniref:VanZ family protein n=1 Tax=Sedimentibacter sp. zth1 TaxID=2816908 RepID=UPI001A9349AA|nr:VanZ family protein [Sedimentibacter sp. zth1]QSX05289.1 VanZ family protein [Sedimentibacter sp. zth1]